MGNLEIRNNPRCHTLASTGQGETDKERMQAKGGAVSSEKQGKAPKVCRKHLRE